MDWKGLVKSVAPVLGTALGGPFGGMASKWLAGELLGDENAGQDVLEEAIQTANPETFAKVKSLEMDFKKEMARIGLQEKQLRVDEEKIHASDRRSARGLFKVNIWPQIVISAIYIVGYFYVLHSILSGDISIPAEMQRQVDVLLGGLTLAIPMILQFWFGSSTGSKEKDKKN